MIPVAFFAPQRDRLRAMLKRSNLVLGDGMKVLIHGSLDFYAPTGRLSLKMDGLTPATRWAISPSSATKCCDG